MLTGAGEALREHAHVLLRDLGRAREAVRAEAGGPVQGNVTIGLPTTVAMVLTLPLLLAMRERHPGVALHIVESQSGHLVEWLRQGRLDVAVLFDAQGGAAGDEIALMEAVTLPVLLPGREHGFRRLLDGYASRTGRSWSIVAEVDALPHLKRGVAAGLAHTVLPWAAVREEIAGGTLVARRLVEPSLQRTAMLATSAERPASRAHMAAAACIASLARDLVERGEWKGRSSVGERWAR